MNWYIEITLANGTVDKLYCVSRAEARERRQWYLHHTNSDSEWRIVKATVRKVS